MFFTGIRDIVGPTIKNYVGDNLQTFNGYIWHKTANLKNMQT